MPACFFPQSPMNYFSMQHCVFITQVIFANIKKGKYWFEPQSCGSGMFIPDPDSIQPGSQIQISDPGSQIPNPSAATKEEGKKFVVLPFFTKLLCRASVHFFHRLSILEGAADHKRKIIAIAGNMLCV
jgi:hypothetical protein